MSNELKLNILSPERRLIEQVAVQELTLTGGEGQFQILPGHAPMVGTLATGMFRFKAPNGQEQSGMISSGFFEVKDDEVSVLAEIVELRGEIDIARAKKAQEAAEQGLKDANLDEHQFKKYQLKLERALIRQQIAGKEFQTE